MRSYFRFTTKQKSGVHRFTVALTMIERSRSILALWRRVPQQPAFRALDGGADIANAHDLKNHERSKIKAHFVAEKRK